MTYSASRLTLYALLSAIESDLRDMLVKYCSGGDIMSLLGKDVFDKAFERFQKDTGDPGVGSLSELADYLDFADAYQILNAQRSVLPDAIAQQCLANTSRFEKLIPIRNRVAHSRPLNFEDFDAVLDAVEFLETSGTGEWKNLEKTRQKILAAPGSVLNESIPDIGPESVAHNLPIPDFDETGFLGRKVQVEQLVKLILGPYPVISLIGEGGLGKTALALKVAYEFLDRDDSPFDAVVWTTAKSATITAQEIVRIEGAITDSLGMLRHVAEHLAGQPVEDPIEENH